MKEVDLEYLTQVNSAATEIKELNKNILTSWTEMLNVFEQAAIYLYGLKYGLDIFPARYMGKYKDSKDPIDQELFASFMMLQRKIMSYVNIINDTQKRAITLKKDLDELKSEASTLSGDARNDAITKLWTVMNDFPKNINELAAELKQKINLPEMDKKELKQ